jgi:fibronectin type III domain protein
VDRRDVTAGETGFTRLDHPKAAASMLTARGLTHGHEYEFRVRAMGGGGAGPWARVRILAWKGLPLPPANLTATARPGGSAQLTWTAPPGTVTYRVYQRDVTAAETTFTERRPTVAGTTALVTGLAPGHDYEFVVTATNRAGESGRSFPARVTVP